MIRSCLRRKVLGQGGRIQEEEVRDVEDPNTLAICLLHTYARSACFASSRTNVAPLCNRIRGLGAWLCSRALRGQMIGRGHPVLHASDRVLYQMNLLLSFELPCYSGHMKHINTGTMR